MFVARATSGFARVLLASGMFLATACGTKANAADTIATDRPDFVESSSVVGSGRVQLETGVSLEREGFEDGSMHTVTTPTLVRVGVGEHLELRVETDGRTVASTETFAGDETTRGYADIALGFKWQFAESGGVGGGPGIAALVHVDIDSGSSEFRGSGLRPSLRGVAEWEFPADISFGVMPGVVYDQNDEHRFVSGILAVTAGKQLTEKFRGFVEIAGQQIAHAEDGGCIVTYDLGTTYLVNDNFQLDVAIALGANDNTPDWSAGMGLSLRF